MKSRLLITEKCNRNCSGCCNKNYDLLSLEPETNFKGYDEIILTGGEPMLNTDLLKSAVRDIRNQTNAPIYMYTAKTAPCYDLVDILLNHIDGVTVTLHEQNDVEPFLMFDTVLREYRTDNKSLRLNVFTDIHLDLYWVFNRWTVTPNIVFRKNCPLAKNEVFKRIWWESES